MNNKLEVIGIDHGWSMMKTISQVFVTGVKEITTTPALFGDVLEYEGKFYKVGTVRQEVKDTKVEDDSFYLLTLAAVAKELKRRGLAEAKVFLAVGLPLTRFGAEKNDFIKYLTKNKRVSFKYENEPYHIEIGDVAVFPQCYAAVVDKIPAMAKKTLIVDIGSWTIDIMPVINKSPDESKCVTIPKGLITCMRSINEQCVRQLNGEVDESEIQNIMRYGRSDIDDEYFAIIKAEIEDFVDKVYNSIREFGYNLKTTPIVFVGGGAVVMKNFGSHDAKNISYNLDVKANAKTALFCVIPDSDKSYNFIIGLLYTQIFQELYYQADFNCGGRLPIHVTFMLDEFANVALPDDFCSLLSTMRSREISSIIIIQNFAQLKALFKDTWETIPGNCDTFIYLGGNEQSTHKYVSELLGKGTIDKKSSGETKGRQGSSSRNYDVLGRELFTPDEVRKLDNKKCIIFIRGFDPIMDNKFIPFNHPMFNQTADGKGEPYVHQIRGADNLIGPPFEILSDKAVKYYEKLRDKGENVYIDSLTYEQFMMLGDAELSRRFSMQDEAEQKAKIDREQANELEYVDESQKSEATESANASSGSAGAKPVRNPEREKPKWEDTITNRMLHWSYTPEQKEELKMALAAGVPKATILTYFYPEVTAEKMSSSYYT